MVYTRQVLFFDPVAGGEALLMLEVGDIVRALAVFADPATGAPRLACASGTKVLVVDPVAGGDALLVLDIGSDVKALEVFEEPATNALRLACGTNKFDHETQKWIGDVRVFDAVSGENALLVLDKGYGAEALVVFKDLATGAAAGECASDYKVRASTRSRAARRGRARRAQRPCECVDCLQRSGKGPAAARERMREPLCESGTGGELCGDRGGARGTL